MLDLLDESTRRGRPTAREYVAGKLRQEIVRGGLAPGTRLNPNEVAEQLGVSQTPAREAIQLLASEGLVRNDSFRGARVSELTVEEYEELYLMRIGLESLAARLGAESIGEDGIAEMDRLLDEMAKAAEAQDVDTFYERDRRFHLVHYSASGRESLVRRIMALRVSSERYVRMAYVMPHVSMKDTLRTHRELLAAVRKRDAARCERVIRKDLLRTLETFTERFPGSSGEAPAQR